MFHDTQNEFKNQIVLNLPGWPNEQRVMLQLECDMCFNVQCDDSLLW